MKKNILTQRVFKVGSFQVTNFHIIIVAALILGTVIYSANRTNLRGLFSSASSNNQEFISEKFPMTAPDQKSLSVVKPSDFNQGLNESANYQVQEEPWQEISSIPYQFSVDIKFTDRNTGFMVAEKSVYRTRDAGRTWNSIMAPSNDPPQYLSGLAISNGVIYVTGYSNAVDDEHGLLWISRDNGTTWQAPIKISENLRIGDIVFSNSRGLVAGDQDANGNSISLYNIRGGSKPLDWRQSILSNGYGWFGGQITMTSNLKAVMTGISYCVSQTGGASFDCKPSIDPVFDGVAEFYNDNNGLVAGGIIFPETKGWIHRTMDGGQKWTDRLVDAKWPIRSLTYYDNSTVYAAGGDAIFASVGGVLKSIDGGQSWTESFNSGTEIRSCSFVPGILKNPIIRCVGNKWEQDRYVSHVYELVIPQ